MQSFLSGCAANGKQLKYISVPLQFLHITTLHHQNTKTIFKITARFCKEIPCKGSNFLLTQKHPQ